MLANSSSANRLHAVNVCGIPCFVIIYTQFHYNKQRSAVFNTPFDVQKTVSVHDDTQHGGYGWQQWFVLVRQGKINCTGGRKVKINHKNINQFAQLRQLTTVEEKAYFLQYPGRRVDTCDFYSASWAVFLFQQQQMGVLNLFVRLKRSLVQLNENVYFFFERYNTPL